MADVKKFLKNRNNRIMLIILIIGIAFIVISGGHRIEPNVKSDAATDYHGEEERLSEILSQIDGAGRVSVMISYVSTIEKDIAYDGDNNHAVTSGGDVMVKREVFPKVKGVIVIADGGERKEVRQAITEAVTAVTGAGANRICVYDRSEGQQKIDR